MRGAGRPHELRPVPTATALEVIGNLRNFVESGGRIYTTDYSYDLLRQTWPEPASWHGDTGKLGSAENVGNYDAAATVDDSGPEDWLASQGIGAFSVEDNWTLIDAVNNYGAIDEDGQPATFSPTVWVSAEVPGVGLRPATISYQQGCGRALFSTYHTEGDAGVELMAQERALLYVVLEVAVCIGEIGPPR